MWIKHLWILFWFRWGVRCSWTRAVLSASQGGAGFPVSLSSSVPPFPTPLRPKKYVSHTPCLGQKQGRLVLEVGWRWGAEGGMQRKGVRYARWEVIQKPGSEKGEQEAVGLQQALTILLVFLPWGSAPPWLKRSKIFWGGFPRIFCCCCLFIYWAFIDQT